MRIFAIRAARYLGVVIGEVKIPGRDTDDILYEPTSKRVFTGTFTLMIFRHLL